MLRRSIAPAQVLRVDQLARFTFCGFRGGTTLDGIFAKPRRTTSSRCSMPVKTVALLVSGLPDGSGAPAPRCSAQGVARVRLDVGHRDTPLRLHQPVVVLGDARYLTLSKTRFRMRTHVLRT
jgi:hypothetical protein